MTIFRQHRRQLPLLILVIAVAALVSAWLPQTSSAAQPGLNVAFDEAKGGNGNKPEKPPKPPKPENPKPGSSLSAELQPDVWNTNYAHSEGTVSALIRGSDLGKIHLDSIVLVGTDDAEGPVKALRATRQGNNIRAFFAKDDAIDSLETPKRGEVHEVAIEFTMGEDNTKKSLTDRVRIVGEPGDDDDEELDLDLAIQPDAWNVNWSRSNGTVSALIRGEGLDDIDLSSIELVGNDEDADPLPALRASRTGNHVRAFFAKDDAFATLDTPKPGEVHEIKITFTAAGEDEELADRIRVVGPNR